MTTKNRVEAVDRALRILDVFAAERDHLTLKDIAAATGLYKSTILRLCGSLEAFGYLHRGGDGLYRLGPKVLQLGTQYQRGFAMESYVRPVLRAIVDETEETASFYIRDRKDRVCLYRENSRQPIRHVIEEGLRLPLDRGAAGKLLMAYTDATKKSEEARRVRRRGSYFSSGERDPYAAAVAAPVFGSGSVCVGVLAVSGLRERFTPKAVKKFTTIVLEHAHELSQALGA
ncbi:MAG: IclR family transcriptional regulator [Gammaproteobacteria bacterium]|nr:IclR family transcriptional regulator [Gammaproteobacteria bacterium]